MAVVIRMKRTGRSKRPCYRISVADSRSPRDGRTLETLGLYDPIQPDPTAPEEASKKLTLNVERAQHWISVGAQPSDTVRSIFKRMGVYGENPPVKQKRDRSGRKKTTKTRTTKMANKAKRVEAKLARGAARVAERRAAKVAAAAEAATADSAE